MAQNAGYESEVKIDKGQSGSFVTLAEVQSADVSLPRTQHDVATFGDAGMRKLDGRTDFTLSVELNFDMSEATHQDILDAVRDDDVLVDVEVYPVSGSTAKLAATCKVGSADPSFSGGSQDTMSVEFANADGAKWSYTT